MPRTRPRLVRALALAALALLALGPPAARGAPRLLEARLSAVRPDLSVDEGIALRVALARSPEDGDAQRTDEAQPAPGAPLDFDLLGEADPPPDAPDRKAMKRRRTLLSWHQGAGFGLLALQLGATASGQLNFTDKFGGAAPANTGKYRLTHAVLSYATVAAFAASGTLAFLAPSPVKRERRWDRVMLHRVAMFTAAAGMATQAGLGLYAASREGHVNQERLAKAHLAIGYATLAAVATGVGALVL